MSDYITVFEPSSAEYEEKRSRFIANLYHCESEQEATALLSAARSKYWDARHNVYAYVLLDGTARFSDDSEPHGTAGKPVLDVINGHSLKNVMIIVTRYFGGTLLGTGGLVRAYSTAARDAAADSQRVMMCSCSFLESVCDYPSYDLLVKLIVDKGGSIKNTEYTDKIKIEYCFKNEQIEDFLTALTEIFSSKIKAEKQKEDYFPFKIEEF